MLLFSYDCTEFCTVFFRTYIQMLLDFWMALYPDKSVIMSKNNKLNQHKSVTKLMFELNVFQIHSPEFLSSAVELN